MHVPRGKVIPFEFSSVPLHCTCSWLEKPPFNRHQKAAFVLTDFSRFLFDFSPYSATGITQNFLAFPYGEASREGMRSERRAAPSHPAALSQRENSAQPSRVSIPLCFNIALFIICRVSFLRKLPPFSFH